MEKELKYWYLRNHKLFSTLSNGEVKELCIFSNMMRAKRNDFVYLANDIKRIFILKKGVIKIVEENAEGIEITKDVIMQGDIFGELSLDNSNNDIASQELAVVASSEVIICSFFVEDFEKLLVSKPELSLTYMKWVGFKLRRIKMRYSDLVDKDVKTRLQSFFTNYITENGEKDGGVFKVKNYLTQKDIAGIIGATRQTVVSTISALEAEGKIKYDRDFITLFNTA
jgi:CRP/FNR family transcriptional regulator, cyclic AMP receptor protein